MNTDQTLEQLAVEKERRRIIGVLLSEVGIWRLKGDEKVAHIIDMIALRIEHPELDA